MLSGGGTGGHVYPALAVVEELKRATSNGDGLPELEAVLYVGTAGGLEANIVARAGVAFCAVEATGLRGLFPWRMLFNSLTLVKGSGQAWRIVRAFRPDVILATGGYASVPVVIAAWFCRCPVLIYLPDIVPGLAVGFLSRLARRVAVSFDASLAYFAPGKAAVTGYPVRSSLYITARETARQHLSLDPDCRTVLILGGSRGAHSINQAVSGVLERLLDLAQVIHIAGEADVAQLRQRREGLAPNLRQRYRVYAYLYEEMVDALVAADLAIARAGAAIMGEFTAAALPSILVPYPYAGQHQEANADFMVGHGAALKVLDSALAEGVLVHMVERLLADENTLGSMARRASELARPNAARAIAQQLALLSGGA